MRIVVSGTHGSGKSTLIDDFLAAHPGYSVLPDPFELLDESFDEPGVDMLAAQLRISAARLARLRRGTDVIAERGPIDFLAYLQAWDALGRPGGASGAFESGWERAAAAMSTADLLVVLPLDAGIWLPEDEDLELRAAMDDALRELTEEPDLVGDVPVVELAGVRAARCEQLGDAVRRFSGR